MCSVGEQNRTSRCDGIMVAAGLWLGVNVMIASVGDGGGLIEVTWRVTSAGYLPAFSLHTSALSISAAERHRRVLEPAAAWTGIADWTDGVNQTLHTHTHTHWKSNATHVVALCSAKQSSAQTIRHDTLSETHSSHPN